LFLFKHLLFPFDHRSGDAILRVRLPTVACASVRGR
jgi:hypothetical protein